jgi:hypothetical protein
MPARLEEGLLRRYELCRAGFRWHETQARWCRGRVALSDEQVDRYPLWRSAVRGWMRTKPWQRDDPRPR